MSRPRDPALDDEAIRALAREALETYERLLAERPDEVHQPLSEAARTVFRLRDALVARRRAGEGSQDSSQRLDDANALASLAFSCQFPIAGVKWSRMEMARDALRDFVAAPGIDGTGDR